MGARRKSRVLVVEDNDDLREVFVEFLVAIGYDAFALVNGEDAIRYLVTGKSLPDVMIIDLMMPKISGLEILAARAAVEHLAKIPAIVVSAMPMQEAVPNVSCFLTKPVDGEDLANAVRDALAYPTKREALSRPKK